MATALKLRSDIKKLKKGLEAKGVSASLKEKLKSQLQKAENELASLKKTGKAPKKSSVAGTKVALTALQKLIQKKKYGVYQGAGVDLKKDAGEGALATGRRESKGLKSNQYGDKSDNKGNVYYEYRPNRLDVKQPKKKQSYPKLEKGGYMADGGEVSQKINSLLNKLEDASKNGREDEFDEISNKIHEISDIQGLSESEYNKWDEIRSSENEKRISKFSKMADGGELGGFKKGDKVVLKYDIDNRHGAEEILVVEGFDENKLVLNTTTPKIGRSKNVKMLSYVHPNDVVSYDDFVGTKMASGGYMAKGGDLNSIKQQYLQNEDENAHSENVVLLAKHFGTDADIAEAKRILALHEKEGHLSSENGKKRQQLHLKLIDKATKEMAKQGIEFEKGGYMARGGKTKKAVRVNPRRGIYEGQSILIKPWTTTDEIDYFSFIGKIGNEKKPTREMWNRYANKELVIEKVKLDDPYDRVTEAFVRGSGDKVPFTILLNDSVEQYASGGYMADGGMTKKEAIADYEKEIAMVRNEIKGLRTRLESEDVDNEMSNEKFESLSKRAMMLQRYVNEMNLALNKLKGYDKPYASGGYMADGGEVKVGDILTATTGVKVKVIEYDPKFGGRVRVERMDEYATGKPSQFMPLSKFKMASGGYMAEGGALEHGLMVGDVVKGIQGNGIAIYNEKTKGSFIVDISKGSRMKMSNMEFNKYSHGGNVMSTTHRMSN